MSGAGLTDILIVAVKPAGEDFNWMFKVKCTSCREEHPNWVGIDATVRTRSLFTDRRWISPEPDGVPSAGNPRHQRIARGGQPCLAVSDVQTGAHRQ